MGSRTAQSDSANCCVTQVRRLRDARVFLSACRRVSSSAATTALLMVVGISVGASPAIAQTTYTAINLGTTPGGFSASASGISNNGKVVGTALTAAFVQHAFLYSGGAMTDLGTLPGTDTSYGQAVNSSGQVVGVSFGVSNSTPSYHAFLYANGTMTDLGTLPGGTGSFAYGINDSGQVAGLSGALNSSNNAFLYSGGTMTDLGTLLDGTIYGALGFSAALAINASGQVVGYSAQVLDGKGVLRAFLYANGAMTDLGTLPGFTNSQATGINSIGQIVGVAYNNVPTDGHAFLYSVGLMTDLGTLTGFANSQANGISSSGQIVGVSGPVAFVYANGTMTDLNSVAAGFGENHVISLVSASGINDLDQIAATDNNGGAWLLTPISTCQPTTNATNPASKHVTPSTASAPALLVTLLLPPPNDQYAITSIPVTQMPVVQAKAQISGICPDPTPTTTFTWTAILTIKEKGGKGRKVDYSNHIIQNQTTTGSEIYTLTFDDPNAVYGGKLAITASATINGQTFSGNTPDDLEIDGMNPERSDVQLQTILQAPNYSFRGLSNGDVEDVLQRIACRESPPDGQIQFKAAANGGIGPPLVSSDNGIGIFQVTEKRPDVFEARPAVVFDWQTNVAVGVSVYADKVALTAKYPSRLRKDNDTSNSQSYQYYIEHTINPTRMAQGLMPISSLPAPDFTAAGNIGSDPPNQLLEDGVRGFNGFSGPPVFGMKILHEFVPNATLLLTVPDDQLPTLITNPEVWQRVCAAPPGNGLLFGPVGSSDCSVARTAIRPGDFIYVNNVAANTPQCLNGSQGN